MAFAPVQYRVSMRLPTLDAGLNTKVTDIGTPLNATPDCQNVMFDEFGAVRTARGYTKFNSVQIASAPVDGLSTYLDPSGDRILIAACGGSYWYQNGTSFSVISGSTAAYTAGVDVKILGVNDKVVFGNGYAQPYQYDGTNLFRFGITPPAGVAVGTPQAGAALSGVYNYALTYLNSAGVESDYYPIITSLVVSAGNDVMLTDIPLAPTSYGVNEMQLYRTTAATQVGYWLVTALSGLQSAVLDNNPDYGLIVPALLDQGTPPKAKYMVYYRGRMFAAGDSAHPYRIYYSDAGQVDTWPSTSFIEVEKGDGYQISGLEAFGNAIVIHKNDGHGNGAVYLLYIADSTGVQDDDNWYVFKSPAAYSAISDKSQAFFKNLLFYINRTGAYAFAGQDLARSSADSEYGRFAADAVSYDIDTDVKAWAPSLLSKSASITYDNKVWVALPVGSTASTNNKLYVFDFIRADTTKLGVWTKLSAPAVNNFAVSDGTLYGGGYDGYVYTLDKGTTLDGIAVAPYYWTAAISSAVSFGGYNVDHRDNTKVFRILYITHECSGNWNLYVDWVVDFGGATQTGTVPLSGGGIMWGTFLWGIGTWGGGVTSKRSRLIFPNAVGKIIKFKFYVTGVNQTFKIKELELEYNLRSRRG